MKIWHVILVLCTVCGVALYGYLDAHRYEGLLLVSMLDVGQGDAILITDPTGYQLLVDGGPDNGQVVQQLEQVMPVFDRSINMIVLTHPDADHIGGLAGVLDRYTVDTIVDNGVPKATETANEFRRESQDEEVEILQLYAGQSIRTPGGVVFDVLSPYWNNIEIETNDNSIVMIMRYGEVSYLLTGDIGSSIEQRLVESYTPQVLNSTVLKVPHHGSRFSSSLSFLKAVAPSMAIASYSCENDYGHPAQASVRRYGYMSIPVYTTCDRGTFTLVSDGKEIWFDTDR